MSETNPSWQRLANRRKQHGVAAVEFSLVAILFFTLVFGIIEVARAMYICNTLQEVTRRAAALATNADFRNDATMQGVRERAIFRNSPGLLVFAEPITDQHINIDYMWSGATAAISRWSGSRMARYRPVPRKTR